MELQRTVIKELKSGSIDVTWDGHFVRTEFNCSCIEANSICHGMCCRSKAGFSVELEEDEYYFYQHKFHPRTRVPLLATTADGTSCIYLDAEKGLCTIHDKRPKMCRQWHCSPQGEKKDKEIVCRDAGWMLLPMRKEEAELYELSQKEK